MVRPGWVVVLAFAVTGAHSPVALQVEPTPHCAFVAPGVQLRVQAPVAVSQVDRAPNGPVQLAVIWQAPNWNTPTGPAGEAQVLVT